jgi:hypothetical protein
MMMEFSVKMSAALQERLDDLTKKLKSLPASKMIKLRDSLPPYPEDSVEVENIQLIGNEFVATAVPSSKMGKRLNDVEALIEASDAIN